MFIRHYLKQIDETISPLVSLLPLLFVMIITALKEGLEDYSRSKSDKLVNTARGKIEFIY